MTPEQLAEIQRLRDRKVAPKQIARKLGLRPAEVKAAIQAQAVAVEKARLDSGVLPPVKVCLANRSMIHSVLLSRWKRDRAIANESLGMGGVMVVRDDRGRLSSSLFLVDHYCLGVKDAMTRTFKQDDERYRRFIDKAFKAFDEGYEEISLEQARSLVFGAVEYARGLGLEPHRDFEKAKEILGPWPESLPKMKFGLNGKPAYFQGPYDNSEKILDTLDRSVGEGNYKIAIGPGSLDQLL